MSNYRPKMAQKPLVVCVGFLGSQPRHVKKYADLISTLDVNIAPLSSKNDIITKPEVIQYIPPIDTFISTARIRQSAASLGDLIEQKITKPVPLDGVQQGRPRILRPYQTEPLKIPDSILNNINNYQPRKVLFLCLSNNGAFGYANMLNYLKKEKPNTFRKLNAQTAGIIWDSSPSHPNPGVFERGFVSAISTMIGRTPRANDPVLTPLLSGAISLMLKSKLYSDAAKEVTDVLEYSVPYHVPQLYLITEKDDLVLPNETREYVANRSKRVKEFFSRYPSHEAMKNGIINGVNNDGKNQIGQDLLQDLHLQTSLSQMPDSHTYQVPINPSQLTLQTATGKSIKRNSSTNINDWDDISKEFPKSSVNVDLEKASKSLPQQHSLQNLTIPHPQTSSCNEMCQHDIDQEQLAHSIGYHYNQHIFPHYSFKDIHTPDNINGENAPCTCVETPLLDTVKHFPKLDYMRLPPLDQPLHRHFEHSHPENDDFQPGFEEHSKSCPHEHHLDVVFSPKYKSNLVALSQDEKIKPLFDRTERFGADCHHHFLYDFKDSAHVQHIRRHPEDYKTLVDAFCNYAFRG